MSQKMSRRIVLATGLAAAAATLLPVSEGWAQGGPNNRLPTVTITANGAYADVAGPILAEAFDRTMAELDGFSDQISPDQARDSTFRRRILELRLLMDQHAFAYDPVLLDTFREIVDDGYEKVGTYQDIPVIQTLLQTSFRPDLLSLRRLRMTVALSAMRSPSVRGPMRDFLASPTGAIYSLEAKDLPKIWEFAKQTPNPQLDAVGNMAMLAASSLAGIQASGPFVSDVFDPVQEAHFHDVRKGVRSILLLCQMYPDTRQALQGVADPLFDLVSQYGDVNDAFIAYRLAPILGANQAAAGDLLRAEFVKSQKRQQAVTDQRSFEALIGALQGVQSRHQK